MDAVKFLKEEDRMCDKYKYSSDHTCSDCPCHSKRNGTDEICISLRKTDPAKYVEIVEKWSAEHPVKTRQSEFLEIYPRARCKPDGILSVCPRHLDDDYKNDHDCSRSLCVECRKQYWLTEVDEANTNLINREDVIRVVDKHTNEDGMLDEDISVILEEIS